MTIQRVGLEQHLLKAQMSVIDALYGAVAEPGRWAEVADTVSNLVGGVTAVLHRTGSPLMNQQFLASDIDPHYARLYAEHFGAINPWAVATRHGRSRDPLHVNDILVPADVLEGSEFYNDWLRPQDLRHTFNMCIRLSDDETVELTSVRTPRLGSFGQEEHAALAMLLPHMKRAVELSARLSLTEAGRKVAAATGRRLGTGSLLVDASRRVVFCDEEGERILQTGALRIRSGRLWADGAAGNRLEAALSMATGAGRTILGRSGTMLTVPRRDLPPLSVAVGPMDERDRPIGAAGPLAILLVTAPERGGELQEDGLRAMFGLTAAEAKLLVALCRGETLGSHAAATGTSLNTVKTHLKHVFDKTGETRQVDLVRRVTSDVALRLDSDARLSP